MGIVTEPKPLRPKPLIWMGSTKKALRALPADVMDIFGYALFLAQVGKRHESSKVRRGFGDSSVRELIESRARNTYRAGYTDRVEGAVFWLHGVQKKSTSRGETPKRDM